MQEIIKDFFPWFANRAFSSRLKQNAVVVDVIMDFLIKLRRLRFSVMIFLFFTYLS